MGWRSRLKRYNLFPHLVAEDLARGIEHTPINKLEERGGLSPAVTGIGGKEQIDRNRNDGIIGPANRSPDDPLTFARGPQELSFVNVTAQRRRPIKILRFPLDTNNLPYVLFTIFETKTGSVPVGDETTTSLRDGADVVRQVVNGIPGGDLAVGAFLGVAAGGGALAGLIGAAAASETGQNAIDKVADNFLGAGANLTSRAKELLKSFALKRNIIQSSASIALFMPDGITSNYDHEYDALSVTATLGAVGFAAQALGTTTGKVDEASPFMAEAAATLASKVVGGEDFAKLGLFATSGFVQNPQMELIYSTPVLRKFVFDFRLVPRSVDETNAILDIIREFKFYSSPNLPSGLGGRYLIPPAQFQIQFKGADGNDNTKLFKTKNCVLTGISLDYTPNGYATFSDDMPVEIRMQLSFQETAIITKTDIDNGF